MPGPAKPGVMAEFAKMPPAQKAGVFAVIGALLALVYWQLGFKTLDSNLDDARADHDAKVAMNKKLADDIPKYAALKAQMKELKQKIDENQKALPTETELPAFFETINRKVLESGVEMLRSDKKQEENMEGFVKVPIQIEITGTFLQIKRFFASLQVGAINAGHKDEGVEEKERIISIENLTLQNPQIKNREVILSATFIAATFRQEDQPVPAPGAPGAAPGAGSAGPAAPSTAPKPPTSAPLPSATTPAGAKARVEKALDKGDDRNRNATGVDEAKTPQSGSDRLKGGM